MQITINTNDSTPAEMYAVARLLTSVADELAAALSDDLPADAHASIVDVSHRTPTAAEIFGDVTFPPLNAPPTPAVIEALAATIPTPPPAINPERIAAAVEAAGPIPEAADIDASGAPFDPIIHSSAHKKTANGLWKKRRGGPSGAPAAPPVHVPPPPPPAVPPPPPAPGAFRALANRVSMAVEAGKITRERVREICVSVGSPDLMTLNAMPQLIPAAEAAFAVAGA